MDTQLNSPSDGNGERKLCEIVPGTLRVPALPRLGRDALGPGITSDARVDTWFSKPTNVAEADSNRRAAIKKALGPYYQNGDHSGIDDLTEAAQEFGWDPNLGEAIANLRRAERLKPRRKGHPFGHSRHVKDRIRHLYCLVEDLRGSGIPLAEIVQAMEMLEFGNVERQQLFRDYHAGRRLPEFQPQLFLREDRRRFEYADSGPNSEVFFVERIRVVFPFPVPNDIAAQATWHRTQNSVVLNIQLGRPLHPAR